MSKAKPRLPTLSKSLKVKAGPTAVEKVLKQNLREVVIYENSQDQQQEAFCLSTTPNQIFFHCELQDLPSLFSL